MKDPLPTDEEEDDRAFVVLMLIFFVFYVGCLVFAKYILPFI